MRQTGKRDTNAKGCLKSNFFPGDLLEISCHFQPFQALMGKGHSPALVDGISRSAPPRLCVH